ncbi:Aminopeptidase 2 [Venturia inaequalis]|nr:Aminopeptidase 2 [Venturia inaequalis]
MVKDLSAQAHVVHNVQVTIISGHMLDLLSYFQVDFLLCAILQTVSGGIGWINPDVPTRKTGTIDFIASPKVQQATDCV